MDWLVECHIRYLSSKRSHLVDQIVTVHSLLLLALVDLLLNAVVELLLRPLIVLFEQFLAKDFLHFGQFESYGLDWFLDFCLELFAVNLVFVHCSHKSSMVWVWVRITAILSRPNDLRHVEHSLHLVDL